MARRKERLVVIMVEPALAVEFEIWSPHITLVPWFHSENDQKLNNLLEKVAARHQQFEIKAGKVEQWGKREKFEVQLLNEDDKRGLTSLHLDVFQTLEGNGFPIHQKDFLGNKYKPHLALRNRYQRGNALPEGSIIKIKNFTLIDQVRLKVTGRMIKSVAKDYSLNV